MASFDFTVTVTGASRRVLSLFIAGLLQCFSAGWLMAQAPVATSVFPLFGPAGTIVTVSGSNLSNVDQVEVAGVSAIVLSTTSTSVRALVLGQNLGASNVIVRRSMPLGADTLSGGFNLVAAQVPTTVESNPPLVSNTAGPSGQQGDAIALSADGNVAAVAGSREGPGAVWVYRRTGCAWSSGIRLNVADPGTPPANNTQRIGRSVALSADGNRLAIGGPGTDNAQGAVWIFEFNGTDWIERARLRPTDAGAEQGFGAAVALSGDGRTLVAAGRGTVNASTIAGVWVYRLSGMNMWQLIAPLGAGAGVFNHSPAALVPSDEYGSALAISLNASVIAVGAPGANQDDGVVYLYTLDTGTGRYVLNSTSVKASGASRERAFGTSVSLSGRGLSLAVGAPLENLQVGAVYVFRATVPGTFNDAPVTINPVGAEGAAFFGNAVSLSGNSNQLIVGGPNQGSDSKGAAWIYSRNNVTNAWTFQSPLLSPSVTQGATAGQAPDIGQTVALSADGATALVGGPRNGGTAMGSRGAAWAYAPAAPTLVRLTREAALPGQIVGINGAFLRGITGVSFGGVPADSFSLTSSSTIFARVPIPPSTPATPVTVVVESNCGNVSLIDAFRFLALPSITSITPNRAGRGALVTITGNNLEDVNLAILDSLPLENLQTTPNGLTLLGRVPRGPAGPPVNVTVANTAGSGTQANAFTFLEAPVILGFTPAIVNPGDTLIIRGANFLVGETAVTLAGVPLTLVTPHTSTLMRALVGANPVTGNIIATTPGGADTIGTVTAQPRPPFVTSFSPTTYWEGQVMTINGTDFIGLPTVKLGAATVTVLSQVGTTQLTVAVPAGASGEVCVTTSTGTHCRPGGAFLLRPVVTGVSSTTIQYLDTVIVTGNHFTGATQVRFEGGIAASYQVLSPTAIRAAVGLGQTGEAVVANAAGASTGGPTVSFDSPVPTLDPVAPISVQPLQEITLTGSNLGLVQAVHVGPSFGPFVKAATFTILGARRLRVRMPVDLASSDVVLQVTAILPTIGTQQDLTQSISPVLMAPSGIAFSSGFIRAGGLLTITGNHLGAVDQVIFGFGTPQAEPAASITRISPTQLQVRIANGAAGQVQICSPGPLCTVVSPGLLLSASPMTITSTSPSAGCAGRIIDIIGTNFLGGVPTRVTVGGAPVRRIISAGVSAIRVELDASTAGPKTIEIESSVGVVTAPGVFTYGSCPPSFSTLSTNSGLPGTWVTVRGYFPDIQEVRLGSNALVNLSDPNQFQLLPAPDFPESGFMFRVPIVRPNTNSLTVVTAYGSVSGGFTWVHPAPVVTRVEPSSFRSGDLVNVYGQGLVPGTTITILGQPQVIQSIATDSSKIVFRFSNTSTLVAVSGQLITPGGGLFFSTSELRTSVSLSTFSVQPFGEVILTGSDADNLTQATIGNRIPIHLFATATPNHIRGIVQLPNFRPSPGTSLVDNVNVVSDKGSVSAGGITFGFPLPSIIDVNPKNVPSATSVITITGTNLYPPDRVTIDGVYCQVLFVSADFDSIQVRLGPIPDGKAINGRAEVEIVGAIARSSSNSADFIRVLPRPVLDIVEPSVANRESVVVVRGRNLVGLTTITLDNAPLSGFQLQNITGTNEYLLSFSIPATARAEDLPLRVVNPAGESQITVTYIPPPVLSADFSPRSGFPGESLLIRGQNLAYVKRPGCSNCRLTIGGFPLSPDAIVLEGENLRITVPLQSPPGISPISIVTQGGESTTPAGQGYLVDLRVTEVTDELDLTQLFPNPTTNQFTIRTRIVQSQNGLAVSIYNLHGTLVKRQVLASPTGADQDFTVDISDLAPGSYYVVAALDRAVGRAMVMKF